MMTDQKLTLSVLMKKMDLEAAYMPLGGLEHEITSTDINRPALQLVGFFDYFDDSRIQVLGRVEHTYLDQFSAEERRNIFEKLFSHRFPALVITRGMESYPELLAVAEKYEVAVLRTDMHTAQFVSHVIDLLNDYLGEQITMHGVLVEVYGEGILLTGESGVGKSETAIELVKRGHRLIADDAVVVKRVNSQRLKGTAPSNIQYFIELRGIGIINVAKLFGVGAVKAENEINLVVNIVPWNKQEVYDRLGLEDQHMELLGVDVPMYTIPITPGRNLAVILEVAAMNNRQRQMGYNSAKEFTEQINRQFENTSNQA